MEYVPLSPRRAVVDYVPLSPRRAPAAVAPSTNSRVGNLLALMKTTPNMYKPRYRPIVNFDMYITDKKRYDMYMPTDHDRLKENHKKIIELQERCHKTVPRVITKKYSNTNEYDFVSVTLTLNSVKGVAIKLEQPMVQLYTNYFNKGVLPPLPVYIQKLKKFGYPEDVLLKVYETYTEREKNKPNLQKFIEQIFIKGNKKQQ